MNLRFKKQLFASTLLVLIGAFIVLAPSMALAQDLGLNYGAETGLAQSDLRVVVARIINVVLTLLGTVFVCLIIYAGFTWMTSGGNEENVKKAKKIIYSSVIGLLVIASAYAITRFVVNEFYYGVTGQIYRN